MASVVTAVVAASVATAIVVAVVAAVVVAASIEAVASSIVVAAAVQETTDRCFSSTLAASCPEGQCRPGN